MTDEYLYQFRLGNLLQEDSGEIINIGHIQKNFYDVLINGKAPGYYQPIELTDEWLLKFRFIYHSTEEKYGVKTQHYMIIGDPWAHVAKVETALDGNAVFYMTPAHDVQIRLQGVHHLQNLYYALSGNELTLNEPV